MKKQGIKHQGQSFNKNSFFKLSFKLNCMSAILNPYFKVAFDVVTHTCGHIFANADWMH